MPLTGTWLTHPIIVTRSVSEGRTTVVPSLARRAWCARRPLNPLHSRNSRATITAIGYSHSLQDATVVFRKLFRSFMLEPPSPVEDDEIDRFKIPENERFLALRGTLAPTYNHYSNGSKWVDGRYLYSRQIDGHPDCCHYLWYEAGADIPGEYQWVIRAWPAFAHPQTNIIFAATGSYGIIVRLHGSQLAEFPELTIGRSLDDEHSQYAWAASQWDLEEDRRLLALAFTAASRNDDGT